MLDDNMYSESYIIGHVINLKPQVMNVAGSQAVPNPYIFGGDSAGLSTNNIKSECKGNSTLSLTKQLQFARQITLGMVSW